MKKNDLLTGLCDSIGYNGEGIIHYLGTTFFVPYVLCGEKVVFKVLKIKGNIGFGKPVEILEKSPYRTQPLCPVYQKCGGCQFQHTDYQNELKLKSDTVIGCFNKICGIVPKISKITGSNNIYGYRNKLQLPVRETKNGVKVGFFREGSHDIVEVDNCYIHPDWAKDIIKIIKDYIDGRVVTAYNEATNCGLVRHVVVREVNNEFLVTIVINGDSLPNVNRLIDRLLQKFTTVSLYLNINKADNNVILGERFILVYGSGKITLNEFGITYEIGAESFLQVNTQVKKLLYQTVTEIAGYDKDCVVIDGYSGAGVLTAMVSKNAKKAYGVEIVKEAVCSAVSLAKANNIQDKMESICAPCERVLPSLIKSETNKGNKTVLVLDPPRKGVELNILLEAISSRPDKIIYIACSPQSLARDVGVLTGNLQVIDGKIAGLKHNDAPYYTIEDVQLFDLFPRTKHIETLCVLKKTN